MTTDPPTETLAALAVPAVALDVAPGAAPGARAVAHYLAGMQSAASRDTQRRALDALARTIRPDLDAATCPWHRLRWEHTSALRALLCARYAPSTTLRHLAALRGVLRAAWHLGELPADAYALAIDVAPVRGERLARGREVPAAERRALLDAATPRERAAVAILYGAGLRRAELCSLDVDDMRDEGRALRVRGKGEKERLAPLPSGTAHALAAWLVERGAQPGPVFPSRDRRHAPDAPPARMTPQSVRLLLSRLARRAGVAKLSPHDLRRTFAGDHLDEGTDLAVVSRLMGHASTSTTAGYDRRGARAERAAADRLHVPV